MNAVIHGKSPCLSGNDNHLIYSSFPRGSVQVPTEKAVLTIFNRQSQEGCVGFLEDQLVTFLI